MCGTDRTCWVLVLNRRFSVEGRCDRTCWVLVLNRRIAQSFAAGHRGDTPLKFAAIDKFSSCLMVSIVLPEAVAFGLMVSKILLNGEFRFA